MTITFARHCRFRSALLAPLFLVASAAAAFAANVAVLESSVDGIRNGQELSDDRRLDVPFGKHLLVALQQGGRIKQVEIRGPRKGTVGELLNPEPVSARLWRVIIDLARTGGASQSQPAAGRGARVLVNQTPAQRSTTVCIDANTLPVIAMASDEPRMSLRVYDGTSSNNAPIELTRDTPRASWPTAITIRENGLYRLVESGQPPIDITMHVMPAGTTAKLPAVSALEEFERRGCSLQLDAALRRAIAGKD